MSAKVCAGDLRDRVTIQAPARIADGSGGAAIDWWDVATVFAQVLPASGREVWQAMQTQATVSHSITIRYRPDVDAKQRILMVQRDGRRRLFNIRAVMDMDGRREWLRLTCDEGVAV